MQTDMGVTESILSTTAIQSKATLAEALLKKAVTTYAAIVTAAGDPLVFLQSACVAQVCALLCPGMPNRIKVSEASETGYSFKLDSINWDKKKVEFEASIRDYINLALGGEIAMPSIIGVVTNTRLELEYESGDE